MSHVAPSVIGHIPHRRVNAGLGLPLTALTARQAGRRLLAEILELGGNAVAVVDGTPCRKPSRTAELDGGNLLMVSSHGLDVRVRTDQHQCERMALAQGSAHVGLHSGRQPRATVQHVKGTETATTPFERPQT